MSERPTSWFGVGIKIGLGLFVFWIVLQVVGFIFTAAMVGAAAMCGGF